MRTVPSGPFGVSSKTLRRALGITSILLVAVLAFIAILVSTTGDLFRGSGPGYSDETRYEVEMLPADPDAGYYFEGRVIDPGGEGIPNATVLVARNMHPYDEQLVLASVPELLLGSTVPASADARFGPTVIDTVQTDENGYYQAAVDKYEKVEVVVAVTGYHLQDTRIVPALGVQRVDVYPIPESEPGPRPAQNAPYVLPEGFRAAGTALLTDQNELKARAVESLQCHGINVTLADIQGDVESIDDFSGVFKTSIRVRSDACSSVESRTITYNNEDAKVVHTTKGTFTLVNNCANVVIPVPKFGFIKVFKFDDLDGDKIWDSGEQGLPGFKFRITGEGKDLLVTTGAGGVFVSGELPVGSYTVTEIDIPAGWQATTPTEQTVEVKDGELSEVRFGNQQLPAPPAVDITGKKVWLVDTPEGIKEREPFEIFTFKIDGMNLNTQTRAEDGTFRFEDVPLFTLTGPDTVSVKVCEILPSDEWQAVDPPDKCKTMTINKGASSKDFGVWKNRSVKVPGPTPTPTPGASPTPTVSPTPSGDHCLVTILGPERIKNNVRQAKMSASIQWDQPPNFASPEFRWYLDNQLLVADEVFVYYLDGGKAITFWADLNVNHTLRVDVLKGTQVVCQSDPVPFAEGTVPPGSDVPGTEPLPTQTAVPAPSPTSDPNDGYSGP